MKEKPQIRKVLFWDIDFKALDWEKHSGFIVSRVFQRGTLDEIAAVLDFYDHSPEIIEKEFLNLGLFAERIPCIIHLYQPKDKQTGDIKTFTEQDIVEMREQQNRKNSELWEKMINDE